MDILVRLCLLLSLFLVILEGFRGFFLMDCITYLGQLKSMESNSVCGFLVFGQIYKILGLFVLFALGFQVLRLNEYFLGFIQFLNDHRRDSGVLSKGVASKSDLDVNSSSKIQSLICKLLDETKDYANTAKIVEDAKLDESDNDCDWWGKEWYDEESEFDVLKLRKMIKIERERADKACLELEKERLAAASASEEAMSMMLRLQTEKSLIELEARQYRRLVEEKELHHQQVIKSLQWLLERGSMGNQLSPCKQKLKVHMQINGRDHLENAINSGICSSLDVDSSS